MKCIEAYPTLKNIPNHPRGLHYSDHLAVYALFEIDENSSNQIETKFVVEEEEDEEEVLLRSACILVEETIQRLQRDRIFWAFLSMIFLYFLFYFHRPLWSTSSILLIILVLFKDLFSFVLLSICIWFIFLGKPIERNALRAIQNAMYLRLRTSQFFH